MDNRDRARFVALMNQLGATLGGEISQPLLDGYAAGLRGLSMEAFERAVGRALAEYDRMPRPSELRRLAGGPGGASVQQRALLAWQTVRRAIREVGAYRSVYFEDPATNAAVRQLGGWVRLCGTDSDQLEWAGKDFLRTYDALAAVGVDEHAGRHLPGLHEAEHREGWPEERAVRVAIGPAPAPKPRPALPPVPVETDAEEAERCRALVRQLAESAGGEP